MDKRAFLTLVAVCTMSIMTFACTRTENKTETVSLSFSAVVGQAPLVFNQIQYVNPGGEGSFKVRDFLFFISNVKLISDSGTYLEPGSYHLVRFDNNDRTYTIILDDVPKRDYQTIEFSIGVDKTANRSLIAAGDLDPNSRMAWSWDVGYKFILFEGGLALDDVLYPLVYHVGFDENYTSMVFDLESSEYQDIRTLDFQVDIMKLFKGTHVIDMTTLPSVKFDRQDAKLIATNYQSMVVLCAVTGCPSSNRISID
ncbi:MAG: hypothetical protein ACI82A_003248 [Candidatus Azotimanducaceae bacterium]|jgi:hypothetical protein